MQDRPFILKGNIKVNNFDEYIIGSVIKNDNVDNKECFVQLLDDNNINKFKRGYKGYIFESKPKDIDLNNLSYCYEINKFKTLINYDVIEILNDKYIRVLYRDDSEDNAIVVTNQCNSNCIMCPAPDSIRNSNNNPNIKKLLDLVHCIPNDTKHLTITGGEPGMIKDNLFVLLNECKKYLKETYFLLLSNGRVFSNKEFTRKFKQSILPNNIRVAIPIYADNSDMHDSITRVKGSFMQSVQGIKNLLAENIAVEIRIVVLKNNYKYLNDIAEFIVTELPNVKLVNIMAQEVMGNAFKNKDIVWISFDKLTNYLYNACITLIKNGINTNLYNFPLCNIDKRLYSIAKKSISDYKVRYKNECNECIMKKECGGFFFSTINVEGLKVNPIKFR